MDDFLSSIRRSVDDDMEKLEPSMSEQTRGNLMRGVLREMRLSIENNAPRPDASIEGLRERIRRNAETLQSEPASQPTPDLQPTPSGLFSSLSPTPAPPRVAVPQRSDFSAILNAPLPPPLPQEAAPALRRSYDETNDEIPYQPASYHGDEAANHSFSQYQNGHRALPGPIMSPSTEHATANAFRDLSDTLLARAIGDRNLEDMTRDLLREMIQSWLDENLPALVEALVREEIERVARRGR